jgi:hypothetical protein
LADAAHVQWSECGGGLKLLAGLNPSLQRRLNMFDKKRYMHSMRERERENTIVIK